MEGSLLSIGATDRDVPFSIPDCDGRSFNELATLAARLLTVLSLSLVVPLLARLSIAAIRASREEDIMSAASRSLSSP